MRQVSLVITSAKPVNVGGLSFGGYSNIALIEHDADHTPKQVRETKKGNAKIIKAEYRVHVGSTEKSYGKCLIDAFERQAQRINEEVFF